MRIKPTTRNKHVLSEHVYTFIREGMTGWQAAFTVQQQTFYLPEYEGADEKSAKWYQKNLDIALKKMIENKYEKLLP